jgi:hypothetical protein
VWVQSEREVEPRTLCSVLLAAVAIPKACSLKAQPRYDPAVSGGCRPSTNWYRLYLGGPRRGFGGEPPAQDSNVFKRQAEARYNVYMLKKRLARAGFTVGMAVIKSDNHEVRLVQLMLLTSPRAERRNAIL